jgi:hypothetical protein
VVLVNGLQGTRDARGPYRYRYAEPAECGPRAPLQLEFWLPKGRKGGAWVKAAPDEFLDGSYFRTWRKVRFGHSHADKLAHSIAPRAAGYAVDSKAQCERYLARARLKGLQTVSVFPKSYGQSAAKPFGFTSRAVDPADYDGNAPIAEECDE